MSWSTVHEPFKKPLGWWYNKLLCELAWYLGSRGKYYYKYLNRLCKYGYNLYGQKLKQ